MSKNQTGALLTFFALTFGWTWGLWAIVALQELGLTGLTGCCFLLRPSGHLWRPRRIGNSTA